jgi:hypothetical protein
VPHLAYLPLGGSHGGLLAVSRGKWRPRLGPLPSAGTPELAWAAHLLPQVPTGFHPTDSNTMTSGQKAEVFLAAQKALRAHPDWTDEEVADHLNVKLIAMGSTIHEARRELEQDSTAAGTTPGGQQAAPPTQEEQERRAHELAVERAAQLQQGTPAADWGGTGGEAPSQPGPTPSQGEGAPPSEGTPPTQQGADPSTPDPSADPAAQAADPSPSSPAGPSDPPPSLPNGG